MWSTSSRGLLRDFENRLWNRWIILQHKYLIHHNISHTSPHISLSHNNIFTFPKTFQFSICVARERKEDDLILSPMTCGIVVNWKKDIKYPFEGQDTITLWRWKLLYYLCLKTVYWLTTVEMYLFTIFAGSSFKVSVIDAIFYVWDLQCRYTNNVVQILWSCGYFL